MTQEGTEPVVIAAAAIPPLPHPTFLQLHSHNTTTTTKIVWKQPRTLAKVNNGTINMTSMKMCPLLHSYVQMYEVKVTRGGRAALGWADATARFSWVAGTGVGDDNHGWAFGMPDGRAAGVVTAGKWQHPLATSAASAGATAAPLYRWVYGDVIGVLVDLDSGTAAFTVNGVVDERGASVVLPRTADTPCGWLFPAMSYHADFTAVVNLGGVAPFLFPVDGHRAVAQVNVNAA
jgi:hypothetical protein